MQIRYPIKLKSIVKRLSNMFMESRFTIPLSKSGEECKSWQKESLRNVSRSGRPYPNIVHNIQSPDLF